METIEIDESIQKKIRHMKSQLKKIQKPNSDSYLKFPEQITIYHIIYNRLRRQNRRPHLQSVEIEDALIKCNGYYFENLNKKIDEIVHSS